MSQLILFTKHYWMMLSAALLFVSTLVHADSAPKSEAPQLKHSQLLTSTTLLNTVINSANTKNAAKGSSPRSLSVLSLGAKGDGKTDDSARLQAIFKGGANGACYDGENKVFAVKNMINIANDICLKNFNFVVTAQKIDTHRYLKNSSRLQQTNNPLKADVNEIQFLNNDPVIPESEINTVTQYLNRRVLLIRGTEQNKLDVQLSNIHIDRGDDPASGSRTDSSAIWIDHASRVKGQGISITGHGKGHGIAIYSSRNIVLEDINIHDMIWSLYPEEIPLTSQTLAAFNFNELPMYEFDVTKRRFGYLRAQEQINGLYLVKSSNITLNRIHIRQLGTYIDNQFAPWQTDGISVADVNNLSISDSDIALVWEGIDIGGESTNFWVSQVSISDSFAFALKIPHRAHTGSLKDISINGSGYAGVVASGTVHDITLSRVTCQDIGLYRFQNQIHSPWLLTNKVRTSCLRIMGGRTPDNRPTNVTVSNARALTSQKGAMHFGFFNDNQNDTCDGITGMSLDSRGHAIEGVRGL